jgi:polynucleotide 5'-hydroxyl-kinase GRC3/NOL9
MPSTSADDRNAGVVPLVINTQGWVKGLGMDLLVRIEQEAEVTDVFEFEAASGGPGDEWEDGGWEASIPLEGGWGRIWSRADGGLDDPYRQSSRAGPRRHFLSPVGGTPLAARWTASDLRLLSLITYFHAQFPTPLFSDPMAANASPLAESWHFDLPLVAHRPWAVDWTKAFTAVYLAGAGSGVNRWTVLSCDGARPGVARTMARPRQREDAGSGGGRPCSYGTAE